MTPQQRKEAARYLKAFDFSGLFTDPSIGWDWPDSGSRLKVPAPGLNADGFIDLAVVAEKKGVKVLLVPPVPGGEIMPSDKRRNLEKAVTPLATEHLLIFADAAKSRQIWLWTSRLPGKPVRHRELTWEKGRPNELLLQKLTSIAFTLDEEEALDITGVVQRLRDNLDRDRLTKRFYDDFKKHKDQFQKFIKGLSDAGIMAHYTSLMLNRLMFCYFLQQKGFLDGDQHYLRNRFEKVRELKGKDKFHSFYCYFLKRLFRDGLDTPLDARPDELTAIIGKNIPYLNGGIFAEHKIEKDHPEIQIPDEAFEKIFAFFDAYQWHLDDRPLANGDEINPEVLGYVFEKYTNQKEMGAYYTKEDITEYISKNTILPFLLQKVAAKLQGSVGISPASSSSKKSGQDGHAPAWDLLKSDPDRYIYEPVRRGAGSDEKAWKKSLPEKIAIGLEKGSEGVSPASSSSKKSGQDGLAPLQERRKHWNTTAPASHALPTEIWRETIARHQRCHELRKKLRAGEVKEPADLVTLNLDVRQFTQDVIAAAPADLALALWKALRGLSVLDPTCGSGAFLFAALEILEPLYEGLLERLRALRSDWQASGEKHPVWEKEIKAILDAIDRHPNEAYFIHKTIIVHNLYGVDIMEEAVEICKLRLFLKLAAQLEPGQAVEPLPDIDFNVRAGNTLVGYASRDEIRRAFTEAQGGKGGDQMALLGIENSLDDFRRIMEQAEDADRMFQQFQLQQDLGTEGAAAQRGVKEALDRKLNALRSQLDQFLAGQYGYLNTKTDTAFKKWQASHEPFHWFVEFYGIMNSGGFDVIVGNPPYVEYSKIRTKYTLLDSCQTLQCGNLYAFATERSYGLASKSGWCSLIVPLSLACTSRSASLRSVLNSRQIWLANFDMRPGSLFEGVAQRLTIFVAGPKGKSSGTFVAGYRRWSVAERPSLMAATTYSAVAVGSDSSYPKVQALIESKLLTKLPRTTLATYRSKSGKSAIYVHRIVRYFIKAVAFEPHFVGADGKKGRSDDYKPFYFSPDSSEAIAGFLNSTLFYWLWRVAGDGFHCGYGDVDEAPFTPPSDSKLKARIEAAYSSLIVSLKAASVRKKIQTRAGSIEYQEFSPSSCKPIIDQIDTLLAEHYGFTAEELDFIINYDIKYRMGLSGGSAEEVDDE